MNFRSEKVMGKLAGLLGVLCLSGGLALVYTNKAVAGGPDLRLAAQGTGVLNSSYAALNGDFRRISPFRQRIRAGVVNINLPLPKDTDDPPAVVSFCLVQQQGASQTVVPLGTADVLLVGGVKVVGFTLVDETVPDVDSGDQLVLLNGGVAPTVFNQNGDASRVCSRFADHHADAIITAKFF